MRNSRKQPNQVLELEKAMSHFQNEQLEMKESTIARITEEAEKHNKSIRDKILPLNLWGKKWNFIVHGIAGEIKETSKVTRHKVEEFFHTALKIEPSTVKHMTSHAKTYTNGYLFEWLKTVRLPFVIRSRSIGGCSNSWGYPFRKIGSCLNRWCYQFKKNIHPFQRLRVSIWKKCRH